MAKLGDVCNIQSGGTPSRSITEYWDNGQIPWVKISDIKGKYIDTTEEYITDSALESSSAKLFPKGTLLFTIFATLGETGILQMNAATNQAIAGLQIIDNQLSPDYMYYYLLSKKAYVNRLGRGVAQNNINLKILRDFDIAIPPQDVQSRIVAQLNRIMKLIDLRKYQLQKLDELVKVRFVEMFGDPVRNDKNWPMLSLSSFAEIKIGPFGSLLHKEDYTTGCHFLVNPSHIVDGQVVPDDDLAVTDEKYREMEAYHLHKGDIVLGRRGEMGRCAVVHDEGMLCGTGSLIIRLSEKMHPYFLQKIISYPTFKKYIEDMAVGVTMMNLNVPIVSGFMIPVLPMEDQISYLHFIEKVDQIKLTVQQGLEKLELMKKKLMQLYFEGGNKENVL